MAEDRAPGPPAGVGLVVTCEHGGRCIPARWKPLFDGAEGTLASHRGWDRGAPGLAQILAERLGAEVIVHPVSRLLVDTNRSPGHPRLFSAWTRRLSGEERETIMADVYRPHRERVERAVRESLARDGRVVHLGVHTFTPVLDGVVREADVALLYDPGRGAERAFAEAWARRLREELPELRVRRNEPYRGVSDGLTTYLRRRLGPGYLGLELEVGQGLLDGAGEVPARIARGVEVGVRSGVAALGAGGDAGDRTSTPG